MNSAHNLINDHPGKPNLVQTFALVLTVPCAIIPIMLATSGISTIPYGNMFFPRDWILFVSIYLVYAYGLYLSYQIHGNLLPFFAFFINVATVLFFVFLDQLNAFLIVAIISIMVTSICNQYYRNEFTSCPNC